VRACSSFDAKWRAAKDDTTAHGPTRWDGRWTSEKHRTGAGEPEGGRLRCVLSEAATNCFPPRPGISPSKELSADFHANWSAFSANYTLLLTPVHRGPGPQTDFRGTHELPAIFGGTYRYTAHISGDHFTARYDSSYDHGTFALTRVRP
jgi:hypothetical protein